MATRAQVISFINTIAPQVVEVCKSKQRKILPSVCIAQACCESGYGTIDRMLNANAMFGIKVGSNQPKYGTAWKGKAYSTKTKECYDGSSYVTITDMFRAYDTIRDSIEDYYDLLAGCSRYSGAIGVTDPKACITAIKNGGYATDPNYINIIISIINYNSLTKYDTCMSGGSEAAPGYQSAVISASGNDSKLKHKLGESIKVNTYYSNSVKEDGAIESLKTGIILRVVEGARNPYCFGDASTRVAIGWCNDSGIVEGSSSTTKTHTVIGGDTLNKISTKYNTTVDKIVSKNKSKYPTITPNYIRVGWILDV